MWINVKNSQWSRKIPSEMEVATPPKLFKLLTLFTLFRLLAKLELLALLALLALLPHWQK